MDDNRVSFKELYEMYRETGTVPPDWLAQRVGMVMSPEDLEHQAVVAGIPRMFASVPPDDSRLDALSDGGGIYIHGRQGSGKTWLACAMAKAWMLRGLGRVRFISSVRLVAEISDTYGERGASETQVLSSYDSCPLLVVDDLGKEVPTRWAMSRLFSLFDARYSNGKPTIVTTQFELDALARRMSDSDDPETAMAIVSRFREKYRSVNLGSVDRRAVAK